MWRPFETLPPSATIENFNVVETLSDNAIIVYQTHKVNWHHGGSRLCWNTMHTSSVILCSLFDCQLNASGCISESVACLSERRALSVSHQEDLSNKRKWSRHMAGLQLLCGPRQCYCKITTFKLVIMQYTASGLNTSQWTCYLAYLYIHFLFINFSDFFAMYKATKWWD